MKAIHKSNIVDVRLGTAEDGRTALIAYPDSGPSRVLAYAGSLGLDWLGWNDGAGVDFETVQDVLSHHGYVGVSV